MAEEKNMATPDPISKAVVDAARRHIFYTNERGERFNMTALHRMNLHYLRKRILDATATILKKGAMDDSDSDALTSLMQSYCNAVRDREFIRDVGYRDWHNNLFLLRSEREMERELLTYLKTIDGIRPEDGVPPGENHLHPDLPGGPWDFPYASRTKRQRYVLAVLGGVILNAPMVLMALVPNVAVNLVTAGVCTMVFAVAAAYFSPTKLPLELLAATATYAAVLVVFVGGVTTSGGGCETTRTT
ncbi:hypothetical protein QBC47DRAFT_383989 [Echria macrotheca]|uniref:DUF6594 domain-containing protein n=1 Tax=Echria macrotheca TaxID=438768 RepID=A0AAJ0FAP4_9PEZI|nr:hypothetical protein QBC47DRAFT_383989 [Echria macrotheca]